MCLEGRAGFPSGLDKGEEWRGEGTNTWWQKETTLQVWWARSAVHRWRVTELSMWNFHGIIYQYHPRKFNFFFKEWKGSKTVWRLSDEKDGTATQVRRLVQIDVRGKVRSCILNVCGKKVYFTAGGYVVPCYVSFRTILLSKWTKYFLSLLFCFWNALPVSYSDMLRSSTIIADLSVAP